MSRWTKLRDKAEGVAAVVAAPFTLGQAAKLTSTGAQQGTLGKAAAVYNNAYLAADVGAIVAGGAYLAAPALFGATTPEALGIGAEVTVPAEEAVSVTGLETAGAATSAAGAAGTGGTLLGLNSSTLSTLGLVGALLKKGNVAGAVDAITGTNWGTDYLGGLNFGGGEGGAAGGGMSVGGYAGSKAGAKAGAGISPVVIVGGAVLAIAALAIFRRLHK